MNPSESDIQLAICDYLALKNYFFWRSNSVGIFDPTKKIHRKPQKYHRNGVPDIILIRYGRFIGLEVKTKKGRQSDNQKEFEKDCKANGADYHIVCSVDDVIELGI